MSSELLSVLIVAKDGTQYNVSMSWAGIRKLKERCEVALSAAGIQLEGGPRDIVIENNIIHYSNSNSWWQSLRIFSRIFSWSSKV